MNITYREIKPSIALQPYVDCYWLQEFDGPSDEFSPVQHCAPLGMMELLVNLNGHTCQVYGNGAWHVLPDIFLAGMYPDMVFWRAEGGVRKLGIRLKPETFHLLFKAPPAAVFNDYTLLDNFTKGEVVQFHEQLSLAPDIDALVARAEQFLIRQLRRQEDQPSYIIEAARLIRSAKGGISMEELSRSVYVSPRQLQRSFREQIGTTPKTYQRIIRFRNAYLDMQRMHEAGSWTSLCYDLGYSDQAHLIREFKAFTGITPGDMLQKERRVFSH